MRRSDDLYLKWQNLMEEAQALIARDNCAEAETALLAAVKQAESMGYNNSCLAFTLQLYGQVLHALLKDEQACEAFEHSARIFESARGPLNADLASSLTLLGQLFFLYDLAQSEKHLRRAAFIYRELGLAEEVEPVRILACVLSLQGKSQESRKMLSDLVRRLETKTPPPLLYARALAALDQAYDDDEDEQNVLMIAYLQRSLDLLAGLEEDKKKDHVEKETQQPRHPFDHDDPLHLQVQVLLSMGKRQFCAAQYCGAEQTFQQLIALIKSASATRSDFQSELYDAQGRLARLQMVVYRNYDAARDILKKAVTDTESVSSQVYILIEARRLWELSGCTELVELLSTKDMLRYKSVLAQTEDRDERREIFRSILGIAILLTRVLNEKKCFQESAQHGEWVLEQVQAYLLPNNNAIAILSGHLAQAYLYTGRNEEAVVLLETIYKQNNFKLWSIPDLDRLSRTMSAAGLQTEAFALLEAAREKTVLLPADENEFAMQSGFQFALMLASLGQLVEAEAVVEKALTSAQTCKKNRILRAAVLESYNRELAELDPRLAKKVKDCAEILRTERSSSEHPSSEQDIVIF